MPPKRRLADVDRRAILHQTAVHTLYFLSLDRIGHHLIVETRAASARIFQCYVQSMPNEDGDYFGFSAREWVTGNPDDPSDPLLPEVLCIRNKWGGADPLNFAVLTSFLDLLVRIEEHVHRIGCTMLSQVPERLRLTRASSREAEIERCDNDTISVGDAFDSWIKDIVSDPQSLSLVAAQGDSGPTQICSSGYHSGEPFSFSIPFEVASPFIESYKSLIGYAPEAVVFMTILRTVNSKASEVWSVRALTIPHASK